jgi:hypothetical protein
MGTFTEAILAVSVIAACLGLLFISLKSRATYYPGAIFKRAENPAFYWLGIAFYLVCLIAGIVYLIGRA